MSKVESVGKNAIEVVVESVGNNAKVVEAVVNSFPKPVAFILVAVGGAIAAGAAAGAFVCVAIGRSIWSGKAGGKASFNARTGEASVEWGLFRKLSRPSEA